MLLLKFFLSLDTAMADLVLFKQFFGKFCVIFPNSEFFTNMIHFVRIFSIYERLWRKYHCYERGSKL